MPTKTRIIIVSILILLGGALFSYCVFFYPIDITAQVKGSSATVSASEPAPAKDTSIGCVEPDKSAQINQARSERRSRPKTAPT
ncbi:MAG: hypothetical protein ACYS6K_22365 [Planctomycetota bacterium]|jgi:hypothetical protein